MSAQETDRPIRLLIPVDVPEAWAGDADRDVLREVCALALALLATGMRRGELLRRLHGWQPRDGGGD